MVDLNSNKFCITETNYCETIIPRYTDNLKREITYKYINKKLYFERKQ